MADFQVAASTFPYLYSHSGLDALKHLKSLGFDACEMMIFPPHCWPAEMDAGARRETRAWRRRGRADHLVLLSAARQQPQRRRPADAHLYARPLP